MSDHTQKNTDHLKEHLEGPRLVVGDESALDADQPQATAVAFSAADYATPGATSRNQTFKKKSKQNVLASAGVLALIVGLIAAGILVFLNNPNLFHTATPVINPDGLTIPAPDSGIHLPALVSAFNPFGMFSLGSFGGTIKEIPFTQALDFLTQAIIVIGLALYAYAKSTRRQYITIDAWTMVVSDSRQQSLGKTKIIPWKCMQHVEVHYPKEKGTASGAAQQDKSGKESKAVLHIHVDDGCIAKVRWKDIVTTLEPGQFINAMRTWAPDACSDTDFPDCEMAPTKIDGGAYTQLWFKYYTTGADRKRTTQLQQGDNLMEGRFEVAGQIGGGGQGTAYLAVDHNASEDSVNREVVLKEYILPVHRGQQVLNATIDKLEQEADILRRINHENIVHMLDSFVEDHRGYLVMEYVSGRQIKDIVLREGPQPELAVMPWALQICDVLSYLHNMTPAVVHRDLTPDNLILQNDGLVKVVDFNVAHQLESAATATVVGKHCYIPPEQFRGRPTAQSDIYALGCTLHFILTGQEPEPLTCSKPRTIRESVSEELNAIVARATNMDPNRRYLTAEQMKADLLEIATPQLRAEYAQRKITMPTVESQQVVQAQP